MGRSTKLIAHHPKSIQQKIMSLIQNSTHLNRILQIHAFILKSSLDQNNFILATLLRQILSLPFPTKLPYAHSLFTSIKSPDTFIYNTMIKAHLNSNNPFHCLSLFTQLHYQDCIFIDSFSLSLVIQACGVLNDVQNGLLVHTHVMKLGFCNDLFVQTCLVKMYGNFGLMGFARKVFDEMGERDLVCNNVMLGECVRVGEMGLARKLFDEMREKDLVSWNTMIHGYASVGNMGDARALFDTSLEKDMFSWSSMIGAYAKNRQSNEALRLFYEMQLANVVPDKVTMVSVLRACGDVGALGTGKMVHQYIGRHGIEIDLKLGTGLVDMYAKCGDIDNAMSVFGGINDKDVFAWGVMISGLANHGFGEVALDHFSNMISQGIKPNDVTFIGVLSACSHIGLVDKGWAYFNSMSKIYDITPKIEHYGSMVDILGRAGRLQEARELITKMPFEPDAVIWRALLGACKSYKNVELAEEATAKLLTLEPHADGNYVLLSNIYSQAKKWDEVVNLRRMMKNVNIQKVPGSSSIEVGNAVHEFVAGDKSHQQSDEIYQMLTEMILRLKQAGYEPLTALVLQDLDDKAKETALAHHSEKLAIAFGLISTAPGLPIRIVKNLRVCDDCHTAIKFISKIYDRKIIVRDRNRFHHFMDGSCSCKDYW